MARYGIPYKGNKSKIAEELLAQLPSGKRLVDLFGGGFAITDCALRKYPYKWEKFYYNDFNPLLQPLIMDAIHGKYNPDKYKPKWISREEFHERKNTDGYIAFVWSFGNNGRDYLYGEDVEETRRKAWEFVVDGIPSDITEGIELKTASIHDRRIEWQAKTKGRLQDLERMQALVQLESLSRLDYRDYKYQDGDVIYCDIPYDEDGKYTYYGGGFDHKAFYEWANTLPVPVYYSNYTKGSVVWQKEVRSVYNSSDGAVYRNETLFAIGGKHKQEMITKDYESNQIDIFEILSEKES